MDIETELISLGALMEARRINKVSLSHAERVRILKARKIAKANDMSAKMIAHMFDEGAALARGHNA